MAARGKPAFPRGLVDELRQTHRRDVQRSVLLGRVAVTDQLVAVFGRKDYQQWKVLERMARDLDMPIDVAGMPTVREPDGLAMSSRNRYLSAEQRVRALGIARGLRAAHAAFARGERSAETLGSLVRAEIAPAFDTIDYVDLADPETLEPAPPTVGARALITVAARIGATRLIDNTVLGEDTAP